jgi:hypothetical protein
MYGGHHVPADNVNEIAYEATGDSDQPPRAIVDSDPEEQ